MALRQELKELEQQPRRLHDLGPFKDLQENLRSALSIYWSTAAGILQGSGIELHDPSPEFFSLDRNFFSALFLYSYGRAGFPKSRRILYAAVNQCLRGMVTGCDNILDDEYKKTLETDLPEKGVRFRSVLDIMVSDRVLFEILLTHREKEGFSMDQVLSASAASLAALTRSGAQEASEEGGIMKILEPGQILEQVHHYKTGMLFQCPWAVPRVIENLDEKIVSYITDALYDIGLGCQIMDDMMDLSRDIAERRHNYIASLIFHGPDREERARLESCLASPAEAIEPGDRLLLEFPRARLLAANKALNLLTRGTRDLFGPEHQSLIEPSIAFLINQIGAGRFMFDPNG